MSIQVDNVNEEKDNNLSLFNKSKLGPEMSIIVEKIHNLPPEKLAEVQKYIDFIEQKSLSPS